MILLVATALAILIALVRGGALQHLAAWPFRYGWLGLLGFGLQTLVIYASATAAEGMVGLHAALLMASYLPLLAMVLLNRRLPGFWLIGIGLGMNLLAMLANGGFMPITPEALQHAGLDHLALGTESGARIMATKDILLSRESTRLWLLSDIVVIPSGWPVSSVFSLGDLLLAAGVFAFFHGAMQPHVAAVVASPGVASDLS